MADQCLYAVRDTFGVQYADTYALPAVPADAADLPAAGLLVIVHAGWDDALRDRLDRVAFERGIPSVGVALLPTRIVCGPAVIPGATACYACYRGRIEQHGDAAQQADFGLSTRGLAEGFGPQHLAITHGLLVMARNELRTGPAGLGGTVRSFDLVAGTLSTAATVAVDRCPRCSARFRSGAARDAGVVVGLP